jgi:putative flavoprotein involved in K+ transport
VHLSVGSRQTPLPQRPFGRDIFSYLVATGLMNKTRDSRLGRRLRDRETLIGSSPRAARPEAYGFTAGPPARRVAA